MTAITAPRQEKSEGRAPRKENAALTSETSLLSVGQPSRSVNAAIGVELGLGVEILPVRGNQALERANVHDVLIDGQRIGGVCYARGAWRVLAYSQARFATRADAVEALLARRGRSQ